MSDNVKKEYSVWAVVNKHPKSLLQDGGLFMSYESAIEKAIKFIAETVDTSDWMPVTAQGFEEMRWQNSKGDKVVISEAHR